MEVIHQSKYAGRLEDAASALREGLFLLQDPWIRRERSAEERLLLWHRHFTRRCRSKHDGEEAGMDDGEDVNFFQQQMDVAAAFNWSEVPRATAVAIVTSQVTNSTQHCHLFTPILLVPW